MCVVLLLFVTVCCFHIRLAWGRTKTSHINMLFLKHETLLKRKKELCLGKSCAPFPSGERGWGIEEKTKTNTTSSMISGVFFGILYP